MKTIRITKEIKDIITRAISATVDYEARSGRRLGITGEVGEVLVCDRLGLRLLADPIAAGFDAVDKGGKRYQIKARRADHNRGRLSRFSEHEFDYAILAVLDQNYEIAEMWQVDYETLIPIVENEKRRNPSIAAFKSVATQIV